MLEGGGGEVEGDWEEEEVVVSYLVGVEGSGGVGE